MRLHSNRCRRGGPARSRRGFHFLRRRDRNRRGVRLTALQRSLAAWLEPGAEESCDWRWRRLDLESRRSTLSRRDPNRRSLPRPPASLGTLGQTFPPGRKRSQALDGALSGSAGARQDRSAGQDAPRVGTRQRRTRQNRSERSRVLRAQCRPNALSSFPRTRAVRWLRRGRGGMQNRDRSTIETLRVVLDCGWRQRHHRSSLLPLQPKVRRLLGKPLTSRLITHFYVAHPCARVGWGRGKRGDSGSPVANPSSQDVVH